MKILSIVFSFRNEEENIPELISRINKIGKELKGWKVELIFVDDASIDRSVEILKKYKKKISIKILCMSRNFGQSACIFAGFNHAKGDAIVYMDSDLQDPPELIPQMIKKYEEGYEVVHTKRLKRSGESIIKMSITGLAYKFINLFASLDLPENVGDFKLISKKAVKQILQIQEIDPYMRGLSIWVGYKQTFLKYQRNPRHKGETQFPLLKSLNPSKEFFRGLTGFSSAPLYISLFIGLITILISIILIVYALYLKFSGMAVPGTSGIIIIISFFSGIILSIMGVIGIYLSKIYEQIKGRPRYIIKDIF